MTASPPSDPYNILGVSKDATAANIKTAYRKLVLKCHPDKVKDESLRAAASDQFQKVQEAYELLIDEERRAKYDDKARLAEAKEALAREAAKFATSYPEKPVPTSTPSYKTTRVYTSGGRRYEERVPEARIYDDYDDYDEYRDLRREEELRASARKYDDYERRARKDMDDRKKTKEATLSPKFEKIFREHARVARERQSSNHHKDARTRDRDRRSAAEDKYTGRSRAYESSSSSSSSSESSDSEDDYRRDRRSTSRRYEEPKRPEPTRRDTPRRSREDVYTNRDLRESRDDSLYTQEQDVRDYIEKAKAKAETDRRPQMARTPSSRYYQPEEPRRASAKSTSKSRATSSGKELSRFAAVVDEATKRRPPAMPHNNSAPATLKSMLSGSKPTAPQPHRSSTSQYPPSKPSPTPLRRSETTPMANSSSRRAESRPSKLKTEIYDSGYSSPNTPDQSTPREGRSSTKYVIVDRDDETSSPQTYEYNETSRRDRERKNTSPPRASERERERERDSERPSRPSAATRSYSYRIDPHTNTTTSRPPLSRSESTVPSPGQQTSYDSPQRPPMTSRTSGSRPLYGEVTPGYGYTPENVRYAEPLGKVNYASQPRRVSEVAGGYSRGSGEAKGRHYSENYRPSLRKTESSAC